MQSPMRIGRLEPPRRAGVHAGRLACRGGRYSKFVTHDVGFIVSGQTVLQALPRSLRQAVSSTAASAERAPNGTMRIDDSGARPVPRSARRNARGEGALVPVADARRANGDLLFDHGSRSDGQPSPRARAACSIDFRTYS